MSMFDRAAKYAKIQNYNNEDTCVYCGEYVPEGRQVCPNCERSAKEVSEINEDFMKPDKPKWWLRNKKGC